MTENLKFFWKHLQDKKKEKQPKLKDGINFKLYLPLRQPHKLDCISLMLWTQCIVGFVVSFVWQKRNLMLGAECVMHDCLCRTVSSYRTPRIRRSFHIDGVQRFSWCLQNPPRGHRVNTTIHILTSNRLPTPHLHLTGVFLVAFCCHSTQLPFSKLKPRRCLVILLTTR